MEFSMEKENGQALSDKIYFWIGMLWCGAVFITYHWMNKPYYIEKLTVFLRHLKGVIG
jgi:hypothetical protein